MPDFTFVAGNRPTAAQWNAWVRDQVDTICTSTTRPSAPVDGRSIYETDTDNSYRWNGTAWKYLFGSGTSSPTWGGVAAPTLGAGGAVTGKWWRQGDVVDFFFRIQTGGAGFAAGTGPYTITVPFAAAAGGYCSGEVIAIDGPTNDIYRLGIILAGAGTVANFTISNGAPVAYWGAATPWALGQTDDISGLLRYLAV